MTKKLFPLTLSQEDIYFDHIKRPNNPLYNIGACIKIDRLNIEKLINAHKVLIENEEIFGIRIKLTSKGVFQYVTQERNISLDVHDFVSEKDAIQWMQMLIETPLDINDKELIKTFIFKIGVDAYWYVALSHHVVMDGLGLFNWAKKIGDIYNDIDVDFAKGEWEKLSFQDRSYLDSERFIIDKNFWLKQSFSNKQICNPRYLHKFIDSSNIPSSQQILTISQFKKTGLEDLSNKLSVGFPHIFLSLISSYFTNINSQEKFVLGMPIHKRKNRKQKKMLGGFASYSPLLVDISLITNFAELAISISKHLKKSLRHQKYPIGNIIRDLREKGIDKSIYEIGFNYQKYKADICFENNVTDVVYLSHNHEALPLLITVLDYGQNQNIKIKFDYNLAFFQNDEIEQLIESFSSIINQILIDPFINLNQIKILSNKQKHHLVCELNDTCVSYPKDKLIHELFEEQVALNPNHVALVFEDTQLSYGQLNDQSNQLAHFLCSKGVGPETLVGICLERSLEMVVSILAVLKAGGAYLPLDPNYPQARLHYMIIDAALSSIITSELLMQSNGIIAEHAICLDDTTVISSIREQPKVDIKLSSHQLTPSNLAYVIYTSGSTGKPKGVMIPHTSVVNRITWMQDFYPSKSIDIFCLKTSINFADHVPEIFQPLVCGLSFIIVKQDKINEIENILNAIKVHNVTRITLVPSLLKSLLDSNRLEELACIKMLISSGETLTESLLKSVRTVLTNTDIVNLYGSSEVGADATASLISTNNSKYLNSRVTIGQPLNNISCFVFGEKFNLLPIGTVGELYIGGVGLARGYLNRPELTAEQFIANPFSDDPSDRLYRTGDLVRYLPDGNLEFIGRIDDQVKIRGFRIELGEIGYHLSQLEGVSSSLALAKDDEGHKRLIAYVVAETNKQSDSDFVNLLRSGLQKTLPDYMVPSAYILLDEFPLTATGKIDKKALPEPDETLLQGEYIAPDTQTEKVLVSIWSKLLRLDEDKLSVRANFFELGGHSLLSIRLMSEIRSQLQQEIAIKVIFESPTIRALSEQIAKGFDGIIRSSVKRVQRIENEPLIISYAQQRLWFIDQFQGGSSEYNMPMALQIEGKLDVIKVEQAFIRIIQRHESLRTVLKNQGDVTLQVIKEDFDFKVNHHDLRQLSRVEQQDQVDALISSDIHQSFDLSRDLMVRVSYIQLCTDDYDAKDVILFNMHHIASDGWSMAILYKEFVTQYKALLSGEPDPLAPLEIQYTDYAHWQRKWLTGEVLKKQLSYWSRQLKDVPVVHSLPLDYPRIENNAHKGGIVSFELNGVISKGLQQIAKEHQLTPFMLLHATLGLVLSRHSNSYDIVIGTPVANRMQVELEPLIGFFVNTLVLRTDTNYETLEEYLSHVREVNLQAQSHQDIPFEQLVEHCGVTRSLKHSPLFQIMFTMDTNQGNDTVIEDVMLTPLGGGDIVSKFELDIVAYLTNEGISLSWTYNKALFNEEHIRKLCEHYKTLLISLTESTVSRISDLQILSDDEVHHLIYELNDTSVLYPKNKMIHKMFEEQVESNPDHIALVFEDSQLSYSQLNDQSNQLAHFLRSQGVGPETLVGICVERSLDMIVGLLGILKAGGAYVPLDPNHPSSRIKYILDDTGVNHLLSQTGLTDDLSLTESVSVTLLDTAEYQSEVGTYETTNPEMLKGQSSSNLAYVIYTSGSTGKPKGVMIEHNSVINMSCCQRLLFAVNKNSRVSQFASFSFDASVWEFFMALLHGASLYICSNDEKSSIDKLRNHLIANQITHITLPPTILQLLDFVSLYNFECIILAGESFSKHLIDKWGQKFRVFNAYGPTESTVCASTIEHDSKEKLSIGIAISNTQLYVLGISQEILPKGVIGELYIAGAGLARGYLNRPELTAERFIANPFSDDPSERLYRTGDLVRYLPDGSLEFIGRIDDQVKIRGFRIELGEIESHLSELEGVSSNLVLVKEDEGHEGHKRLIAYVVAETLQQSGSDFISQLKYSLQQTLPDYMLPSAYVLLDNFPLTTNGKIDKKALPEPDVTLLQTEYIAAETKTEKVMVSIWSKLLRLDEDKLSVTANFFELGGHSLLSIKLLNEIQKHFEIEFSLKAIFKSQNILILSSFIDNDLLDKPITAYGLVCYSNNKQKPTIFIAPAMGMMSISYIKFAKEISSSFNVSILTTPGIDEPILGKLDLINLNFAARVKLWFKEIKLRQPTGHYYLMGHSLGGNTAFELALLLEQYGDNVDVILLETILGYSPKSPIEGMAKGNVKGELVAKNTNRENEIAITEQLLQSKMQNIEGNLLKGYKEATISQLNIMDFYSQSTSKKILGRVLLFIGDEGLGAHNDLKHIESYIQSLFEQRVINENITGTHISVIDSKKLVKKISSLI